MGPDSRVILCRALAALALLLVAACGRDRPETAEGLAGETDRWRVERETLVRRLLLTGELRAEQGVEVAVPAVPRWQVEIRWLVDDGAEVEPGDRLLELDNSAFVGEVEEKRLAAQEAAGRLEEKRAETAAAMAERQLALRRAEAEIAKARLKIGVPAELVSPRERAERELAFERAEIALLDAEEALATLRATSLADIAELEIELAKNLRQMEASLQAIEALSITAPAAGTAVLQDHPWEGRKLQEGDTVWVGMPVIRLPDLASMAVDAVLPDVDDGKLEVGQRGLCTLDAYPDTPYGCRVVEIGPVAQPERGASLRRYFPLRLALDEIDVERMRPGMSVKVEVRAPAPAEALVAPRAALDLAADPPRARLADGSWREVSLGPCASRSCVVSAGLAAGEALAPAGGS